MLNLRDPKTTATGIVLIFIGLISWLFGIGFVELFSAVANFDLQAIMAVILPVLTGTGLLASRDNDASTRTLT
jgi:hypothetical protein